MKHKRILFTVAAALLLLLTGCTSVAQSNVPVTQTTQPIEYTSSIPASGEFADSTDFNNVAFILDYQTVNSSILSTLTEVWHDCSWNTLRLGKRSNSIQDTTSFTVDTNGSITIKTYIGYMNDTQPFYGFLTLVGSYTNSSFVLCFR